MTDNLFDKEVYEALRVYQHERSEIDSIKRNSPPILKKKGEWNPQGWWNVDGLIPSMQKVLTQIYNDFKLGDSLVSLTFAKNQYDVKTLFEKLLENESKPIVISLTLEKERSMKRGPVSHFTAEVLQVDFASELVQGRLNLEKQVSKYYVQIGSGKYSSGELYKKLDGVTGTILNKFYTNVDIVNALLLSGYTPDYIMQSLRDEVQKILESQKEKVK